MGTAFWLTIRVGKKHIPIPLVLLLPVMLLIDMIGLLVLLVFWIWKKKDLYLNIGTGFYLSRLILGLMLWGGRFRIRVQDKGDMVDIYGGWKP
jgi:hypothetical protein